MPPSREPSAPVTEDLRQVPVVERHQRGDAALEEAVDQALVEVEPGLVDPAGPLGEHAGPGHREAVGLQPEVRHQVEVLLDPVVVVARHVSGVAVADLAGRAAERVPDAGGAAVLGRGPLDLERGGRRAPDEALGEGEWCGHPLTAPCMMPPTMCLPRRPNTTSTGTVP